MRILLLMTPLALATLGTMLHAEPPVLTDEFDAFLVTSSTEVGAVVGEIRPVFPNPLKIAYQLIPPVPGGDRRGYLQAGQKNAMDLVSIDASTGEIRLDRHPESYPGTYYAEVRGTNADGSMDQVLIIIAREHPPRRENALDIFEQRVDAPGIGFYATASVDPAKLKHAADVAAALLLKDRAGSGALVDLLQKSGAMMTIFKTFEERNTAIGFYTFGRDFNSQDLQDEEIVPDYTKLGGPEGLRRDASVEEITHLIHRNGIMAAYPELQQRLEKLTRQAIDKKLYKPWDGLPEDSFADEYLALGVEIYYGNRQNQKHLGDIVDDEGRPRQPAFRLATTNDVAMTPENLKKHDPGLHEIVSTLFPTRAEFRAAMGWQD